MTCQRKKKGASYSGFVIAALLRFATQRQQGRFGAPRGQVHQLEHRGF